MGKGEGKQKAMSRDGKRIFQADGMRQSLSAVCQKEKGDQHGKGGAVGSRRKTRDIDQMILETYIWCKVGIIGKKTDMS